MASQIEACQAISRYGYFVIKTWYLEEQKKYYKKSYGIYLRGGLSWMPSTTQFVKSVKSDRHKRKFRQRTNSMSLMKMIAIYINWQHFMSE